MANYLIQFGTGLPSAFTGLTPTFLTFKTIPGGTNVTPPGITEIPTSTGLYYFNYAATNSIVFTVDGFTTGLSSSSRYISGEISALDEVDVQIAALGVTVTSIGNSLGLIGSLGSTFGGLTTNPGTIFGYLKRAQEFNEGNSNFTKASGAWDIYSRGSSTLLATKTLADTASQVTKT